MTWLWSHKKLTLEIHVTQARKIAFIIGYLSGKENWGCKMAYTIIARHYDVIERLLWMIKCMLVNFLKSGQKC